MTATTSGKSRAAPVEGHQITARLTKHEVEAATLMRAAYRVMAHKDNQPASVQEILAEAGLSTRAFYRHFASKDDLLVAMARADSERVEGELAEAVRRASTPIDALRAWVEHWLGLAYDAGRLRHTRVLSSDEAVGVAGRRNVRAAVARTSIVTLAQVLAEGKQRGDFPDTDPDDDARAVQAVVLSLIEARVHREQAPSLAGARSQLGRLLSRLLGAPVDLSR
jgi:AcrR family transcriptional regulator